MYFNLLDAVKIVTKKFGEGSKVEMSMQEDNFIIKITVPNKANDFTHVVYMIDGWQAHDDEYFTYMFDYSIEKLEFYIKQQINEFSEREN